MCQMHFFMYLLTVVVATSTCIYPRPIIGVLSQPTNSTFAKFASSEYIPASYVKWIESAGAVVVPILAVSTENLSDVITLVRSLNGVVFPGGNLTGGSKKHYRDVLRSVFNTAISLFDADNRKQITLWGICLGFQHFTRIVAKRSVVECGLDSEDLALPLELCSDAEQTKFISAVPKSIHRILVDTAENVTYHHHRCGVPLQRFRGDVKLSNFFNVISHNFDRTGLDFVSTIEAKKYPIYGTQWHPEKIMFEPTPHNTQINHSESSVLANQWTAQFFVSECRKSSNTFPSFKEKKKHLIHNYSPKYTGDISNYEQCYFF